MPDIMVRCPTVGAAVPTGVTTEVVKFESIPDIAIPFCCPQDAQLAADHRLGR